MSLNKYMQQTTLLGCLFLALLSIFTLFYDGWQWHSDWRLIHEPLPAIPTTGKMAETIDPSLILDAHLFGKSLINPSDVPISSLHLQVTGIVKIENNQANQDSKVYLSMSGQPSKIYRIGETVSAGVKIYSIQRDAVILENNGRFEKLPLQREPLKFKPFIKKE